MPEIPPGQSAGRRGALLLATWGGCGLAPGAPGTVGSAGGLLAAYALVEGLGLHPWWLGALAAALFLPAVRSARVAEEHYGRHDPPQIVVDEVLGQWITLCAVAPGVWPSWLAGLALFRLFDVVKPYPIRRLEKFKNGYGVVADDLAAGVCAMMSLVGLEWLSFW